MRRQVGAPEVVPKVLDHSRRMHAVVIRRAAFVSSFPGRGWERGKDPLADVRLDTMGVYVSYISTCGTAQGVPKTAKVKT